MQSGTGAAVTDPFRRILGARVRAEPRDQAFAALYQAQFGRIYAYLRYRLGDPAQAEDLAAEVFVRAWRKLPDRQPPDRAVAWLFTTAHNLLADHYRRRRPPLSLEALAPEQSPAAASPEEDILADERFAALPRILATLDQREREIIGLRFVAGLRNREIAPVLGISEGNVAKIIHRALGKLRGRMGKEETDDAQSADAG